MLLHVLEHALIDSLKVFILVFILYFALSFVENYISKKLSSNNKVSPFFGSLLGLIPQCGISVAASDLYIKRKITVGTLVAVFLACSDEAIFILLASEKFLTVFPLLFIKLVVGFISGMMIDSFILRKQKLKKDNEEVVSCAHHHEHHHHDSKLKHNFKHTLLHSIEILIYVFIVNFIFGLLIELLGEAKLIIFLQNNKYLAPLFSSIIGVIPNCASSVVLSELYIINGLSFGALLSGLLMNAGLGLVYLFKKKENLKMNINIIVIMFIISLIIGYLTCLINGF
jgi:hypothetical protein